MSSVFPNGLRCCGGGESSIAGGCLQLLGRLGLTWRSTGPAGRRSSFLAIAGGGGPVNFDVSPHHTGRRVTVYRYLDECWIDDFFAHGRLLLTTYERCRTHEHSVRRDEGEGKGQFYISHGDYGLAGMQTAGKRSYMLCASLLACEELMTRFGTTGYFCIDDVAGFCDAIAECLPSFASSRYGTCAYVSERSITRHSASPIPPDPTRLIVAAESNDRSALEEAFEAMNRELARTVADHIGEEIYFLKPDGYSSEHEFRFVWTVGHDVIEPRVVECPKAVGYCRRR
jgi:hypothetical protein